MTKFVRRFFYFIFILVIFLFGVSFLADGNTDHIYLKFASPSQTSMILGTSRAAQGLQPKEFKEVLGIDIFNYAFNVSATPYGKVYYESILKKHNKEKGGIFILTVDPWSISSYSNQPNNKNLFRENKAPIADMHFVNIKPNFEYLFKHLKGNYKHILIDKSKYLFLHNDGWLEVSNLPMDSANAQGRIERTLKPFANKQTYFSKVRLDYLLKTILYFKEYGEVYIVRLPVHPEMFIIDNKIIPNFNSLINEVVQISNGYLDMSDGNNNYTFNDSNHLHKESGAIVSREIAEWIKSLQANQPKIKIQSRSAL